MQCQSCHAENHPTRQYCCACGALLSVACGHCRFANNLLDRFCGGCGRPLTAPQPIVVRSGLKDRLSVSPERRLVTLVFVDLIGSTALSEKLDPEDVGELYRAYRETATTIIETYDGYVAQFVGDGILAYFGFPQAHENDAVRAVRAALEIGPAVRRLDGIWNEACRIKLDTRIGVHTGLVMIGALGTGTHAEPLAVVGSTPNVAARIQRYAEPGAVVITSATLRLIQGRFEFEDLGRHPAHGVRNPIHILRVRRPNDQVTRFEAAAVLTDLVGREDEVELLLERWSRACAGNGQVVQLSGEPGIGKSRLARAVEERIADGPHQVLYCQCSPFATRSTLHPVVLGLQRGAGFLPDDGADERLNKIEAFLAAAGQQVEHVAPLYAALLSLPSGQRYPPLRVSPARQKELTLAAVTEQLRALATSRPMLLVVEDAQWIDPTSLELLDRLVRMIADASILMLVTFRPEFGRHWPNAAEIILQPLSPRATVSLIGSVAGKRLPRELEAEIVRKTEGIPLFAEELTRTIIESGGLVEESNCYELRGPLPTLGIPATLQESLLARLDRLGRAKEVAQTAAAIGREFSHDLLVEVAALPLADLDEALEHLIEAELVSCGSTSPSGYTFRHALIRDIAYGSLVRPRRQELHARIADALSRADAQVSNSQPELLAHHLTEAGRLDEAIDQWLKAGQRASAISAEREAIDHLSRGLELLRRLPDDEVHQQRALQLLISRGPAQIILRGAATKEVAANYTEALALAAGLTEGPAHFAARWGWWLISPDHREQERRGVYLLELAARLGDKGLIMQAHHCQWATQLNLGKLEACRQHIEAGLALYEAGAYEDELALYGGHDAKVCALGNAAIVAWLVGDRELAHRRVREVLAWAPCTGHAASRAHALEAASQVSFFARDQMELHSHADHLIGLADDHGFAAYRAKATIYLGWVAAQEGEIEQGLELVRMGLAQFRAVSTSEDSPFFANIHAELLGMAGAIDEALAELRRMLDEMERGSLHLWLPELEHCYGRLLASQGSAHTAEAWFIRATQTATAQGARALLARATESLARLRQGGSIAGSATEPRFYMPCSAGTGGTLPDLVE